MNTKLIKTYTYPELSEKAKEKVRIWLDDWQFSDYDREYRTGELEKLGYSDIDIRYSGFWSQGDGASIQCSVDLEQFIKRNKLGKRYRSLLYWLRQVKKDYGYISGVQIKRATYPHYVHEMMLSADPNALFDDILYSLGDKPEDYQTKLLDQTKELSKLVLHEVRQKSRELYAWLESDYEYTQTEEYISDMCEANEYLFDMWGNPVHNLIVEEMA